MTFQPTRLTPKREVSRHLRRIIRPRPPVDLERYGGHRGPESATSFQIGALSIRRVFAATTVAAAGLVACGGPGSVSLTPPQPTGVAVEECADLVDALPRLVLQQEAREVEPADAPAAAWGDPAVVLRCGVERPVQLEPSSPCLIANHVGWLADEGGDSVVVFTTIGRSTYVEVTVPTVYEQPGGALAELAPAVSSSTTEIKPCV